MEGISLAWTSSGGELKGRQQLRMLLEQVRQDICRTQVMFDLSADDRLTDSLIYRLKSLELYRDYLLGLARETPEEQVPQEVGLMG